MTVSCWHVAVGDDVELNQILCSVETAKAEVEIPSPYAGRIVETHGAEGDVLDVGAVLVRIDTAPVNGEVRAPNGAAAAPTLVGYGADAGIDAIRRSHRPLAAPPVRKLAVIAPRSTTPLEPIGRNYRKGTGKKSRPETTETTVAQVI